MSDAAVSANRIWSNRLRVAEARIAELTAEVAKYCDALVAIEACGLLPLTSAWVSDIARNALKEG